MRTLIHAAAVAAVALLAGCAQGPSTEQVAAARQPPPGFACPAAGTTVRGSDGREMVYGGTAADDPEVCLLALTLQGRRSEVRGLFNIAAISQTTPDEQRVALRQLFPFAAGRSASWLTHNMWNEAWTVTVTIAGRDRITTPAGPFDTWRMVLNERGFGFNAWEVQMVRWVRDDGVVVQQEGQVIRGGVSPGSPFLQRWSAIEVSPPR
ncbi:MAG: DUF3108 domain-containing protein [Acetobacteraceae bacterium]|jgi:hypothetical protein|nr:DUF3108 domain-containing protein [Acetobacteraceae bacterium]